MGWVSKTLWPLLTDLWAVWGVEILFAASLVCHIILAVSGSWRKSRPSMLLAFFVWGSYLIGTYVAAFALGKLTVVSIDHPGQNPSYTVELKGLLAPLLLMQLGYPDAITAYAVEDNRLGLRQTMNVGVTIVFVVWVLFRCWDFSSPVCWLYIPLFVAGVIRSVGWVLALKAVYDENSSVTAEDIREDEDLPKLFEKFPAELSAARTIFKAYHRFDRLKPHLLDWLYSPAFTTNNWLSIDEYSPELTFRATEVELSFMYDALYTKAPVLYTWRGLLGRFIGFLCLVSTLCGFTLIFKSAFLIDMHVTYTYTMLVAVISLELYQIILLPLSDWAVVKMLVRYDQYKFVRHIIPTLAEWCIQRKRWSRSIRKFDLFDYSLDKAEGFRRFWWKPIDCVLRLFRQDESFRKYWLSSKEEIPLYLEELVVKAIKELEVRRQLQPFTERGKWSLEKYGRKGKEFEELKKSIRNPNTFDRSIIIWHIATEICYSTASSYEESSDCRGSKLLSDYMMYLLARQPHMLSVTTADISLEYAGIAKLKPFLRNRDVKGAIGTLWSNAPVEEPPTDEKKETILTTGWKVLTDAQKLVAELKRDPEDNKWELICSMWVEMLCYAAYNCHVNKHAKMLGEGGELITFVWLLLAYKTDKYHSGLDKYQPGLDSSMDGSPSTLKPTKARKAPLSCLSTWCGKGPLQDPPAR